MKICAAVEFAHRNLVVHRDIKPSNILANAEGEPKLLDFGIAKLLAKDEDGAQLTTEAQQHLTPICASPEQAKGDPITVATDIYSLGALLYEMLSDQKPHRFSTARPTREELALVIGVQVPPPPSAIASDAQTARLLRGDLDAIVLFAMRKEPEMRYATVVDFTADIRRHLARKPVVARSLLLVIARSVWSSEMDRVWWRARLSWLCWPEFCSRFGLGLNKMPVRRRVCRQGTSVHQPGMSGKVSQSCPFKT